MRVVIDCNVVVSAARSRGVCGQVVVEAVGRHRVALADEIVREYRAVAVRPRHAAYRLTVLSIVAELERAAFFVEPGDTVFGLRDPDDEVYLRTAAVAGAVLVTGNRRDFAERRYGPVDVFSPREFLELTA